MKIPTQLVRKEFVKKIWLIFYVEICPCSIFYKKCHNFFFLISISENVSKNQKVQKEITYFAWNLF